tara:strand:- start:354 stop:629 length:276 start_codon:yes stop_codon:yes gene_type:complete
MTDENRELSDLSLDRKECPKCGAIWLGGQHYWSGTGVKGNEKDLAGLVCNNLGDFQCINPSKGAEGGDSWEKRLEDLENMGEEKQGKWWDK